MIRWILNKSIKFQLILILCTVLFIPAAVLAWNAIMPSKVETAVKGMQEERLNNLLSYIDEDIDKAELASINENQQNLMKFERDNTTKLRALSKIAKGTNIGMYIPGINKNYEFFMPNDKDQNADKASKSEADESKSEIMRSVNSVISSKKNKVDYSDYNNFKIIRSYHPIIYNNTVAAVVWADSPLPKELNYNREVMMYMSFCIPAALLLALILMGIIIKNLQKNIYQVRMGLENIGSDLSYRIEDTGGDIGQIATYINSMADSLEKKEQLEERMQRNEKLASLGHLISGVAHEIRNPLGIISGTAQLMEKKFKHIEELQEYIKIIREQSDRENKVIQELLDYARPSKNLMMQTDINLLVNSILSFTIKYIQDNHITLKLEQGENLPLVLMDCDKIKQVFVNIVINACEAMETGGTLTIATKQEGPWIKTCFKDTGKGMDDNQMDKIFNPYFTTKPKGTGLGLTISNSIVELHGGYIEVKSKKNEGSEFIVALPMNKEGESNG